MSTSNLSAAANDTLQSCSQTAQALIGVCRSGGNRVIGRGNELVWHDPADARHFRSSTMGCPVIMGRRTWESLPARFRRVVSAVIALSSRCR